MTEKEFKIMSDILEKYVTVIHDRPLGSLPRFVLTSFGLGQAKKEIKDTLVKGEQK